MKVWKLSLALLLCAALVCGAGCVPQDQDVEIPLGTEGVSDTGATQETTKEPTKPTNPEGNPGWENDNEGDGFDIVIDVDPTTDHANNGGNGNNDNNDNNNNNNNNNNDNNSGDNTNSGEGESGGNSSNNNGGDDFELDFEELLKCKKCGKVLGIQDEKCPECGTAR